MRDSNERSKAASPSPQRKRLGGYLVEAGLLTPAQVDVALNDQKITGMRFGEILAARGWVKQQTIEYLMQKVVVPEQQAQEPTHAQASPQANSNGRSPLETTRENGAISQPTEPTKTTDSGKQAIRRDVPISKPLPSVNSDGSDVSWVG